MGDPIQWSNMGDVVSDHEQGGDVKEKTMDSAEGAHCSGQSTYYEVVSQDNHND